MGIAIQITSLQDCEPYGSSHCEQAFISFGRSKSCTYILSHPEVSRRHFTIKFDQSKYYIFDEGSKFGTVVDSNKLEHGTEFLLKKSHEIQIPGFKINVQWDGAKPNIEKTQIVARKMMGELLQTNLIFDSEPFVPCLEYVEQGILFEFGVEKSTFILGQDYENDICISHEDIKNNHVKFFRDLHGINITPVGKNKTWVNNNLLVKPILLRQNDEISMGKISLIFCEHELSHKKIDEDCEVGPIKLDEEYESKPEKKIKRTQIILDIFFGAMFAGVLVGIVVMCYNFYL